MTPTQLAALAAQNCVAEGRPLALELSKLAGPSVRAASAAAAKGDLRRCFAALRISPELTRLAERWPQSVRKASERLSALPSSRLLRLPLLQTAAYFFLIAITELFAFVILSEKVYPVMYEVSKAHGGIASHEADEALGLFLVALLPMLTITALGLLSWRRIPGWANHLARARQAAALAALVETRAPADVLTRWIREESPALRGVSADVVASDLDVVALDSAVRAEQAMARFVSFVRISGYLLLSVLALGIMVDVHRFAATISYLASVQ